MALNYFDTSGIVKRYLSERGSDWVAALCQSNTVALSLLSISEVASVLSRRTHEGDISGERRGAIFTLFMGHLELYLTVPVNQELLEDAAALLLAAPRPVRLRTLDALHLAAARTAFSGARRGREQVGSFISSDKQLLQAARWAQLPIANPEDHP